MKPISDSKVKRLREAATWPDLSGTRYEIVRPLGQGGMGAVFLAKDHHLDREVALKVLHVGLADSAACDRMRREARILARLEHPGIVPVHDVGTLDDGRVYYAMKRVQGEVLETYLGKGHALVPLLRIFERICEAVAFAHAEGVLHRDLKPNNIMVGSFGEVLVMDWGVAKLLQSDAEEDAPTVVLASQDGAADVTNPGTVLGTPGYMSPEQARGELHRIDERSDVYALGGILRDIVEKANEHAPRRLLAMRDKALQEAPHLRYASVSDLASDVARFLDGRSVSAYREGPLERLVAFARRYRVPILLILTYVLVRVSLLVFLDV